MTRALEGLDGVAGVRRDGDRFTLLLAAGGRVTGAAAVSAVARTVVMAPARRRLARRLSGRGGTGEGDGGHEPSGG